MKLQNHRLGPCIPPSVLTLTLISLTTASVPRAIAAAKPKLIGVAAVTDSGLYSFGVKVNGALILKSSLDWPQEFRSYAYRRLPLDFQVYSTPQRLLIDPGSFGELPLRSLSYSSRGNLIKMDILPEFRRTSLSHSVDTISGRVYIVDPRGVLSRQHLTPGELDPQRLMQTLDLDFIAAYHPNGRFLYGVRANEGELGVYAIGADDALTKTSRVFYQPDERVRNYTFSPDGKYFYAWHIYDTIYESSVGANGQLTNLQPGFVQASTPPHPRIIFHPNGRLVYINSCTPKDPQKLPMGDNVQGHFQVFVMKHGQLIKYAWQPNASIAFPEIFDTDTGFAYGRDTRGNGIEQMRFFADGSIKPVRWFPMKLNNYPIELCPLTTASQKKKALRD